jgi:hypothetical protein
VFFQGTFEVPARSLARFHSSAATSELRGFSATTSANAEAQISPKRQGSGRGRWPAVSPMKPPSFSQRALCSASWRRRRVAIVGFKGGVRRWSRRVMAIRTCSMSGACLRVRCIYQAWRSGGAVPWGTKLICRRRRREPRHCDGRGMDARPDWRTVGQERGWRSSPKALEVVLGPRRRRRFRRRASRSVIPAEDRPVVAAGATIATTAYMERAETPAPVRRPGSPLPLGKSRSPAVANSAMTSHGASYDTRPEFGAVVGWRRLVAVGFAPDLAPLDNHPRP